MTLALGGRRRSLIAAMAWRATLARRPARALAIAAIVRRRSAASRCSPARIDRADAAPVPFVLAIILGALVACLLAVLVGTGALRVKGLLLAISTMAFAIAAESYIFGRPIFTGSEGALTVDVRRAASSARSTSRTATATTTTSCSRAS